MKKKENKVTNNNVLLQPKSKSFLDLLINYFDNIISERYIDNEELLRKKSKIEEKLERMKEYKTQLKRFEDNIKIEMNKYDFFQLIDEKNKNIEDLTKLLLNDYLNYYIIKYTEKNNINLKTNQNLINFLKLIVRITLSREHNNNYNFENTIDEFIKIFLFSQGYRHEIESLLDIFLEVNKYCDNIEDYMSKILEENIIKYEISERNKKESKIVNINFFNIMESLLRAILVYSKELMKIDKVKFYDFFHSFSSIKVNLQKINDKLKLFSKEIYNIEYIIKIEEAYKNSYEQFENIYEKIVDNLLKQSIFFYNEEYLNLYKTILNLIKIIDETFQNKNDQYINLLFFIFRKQYINIYNEEIKMKLLENFFTNKLLLKKSIIFLEYILKELKPVVLNESKDRNKKEDVDLLVCNFMNLENKKILKYKNIINICNSIKSVEFNEVLLYFFERQCQSYFLTILNKYNNKYSETCCEELILNLSLNYFEKAIQYLYNYKNVNNNNILKFYAITYVKTYIYFYVEINYIYFDKCNFHEINKVFSDKDENNKLIRNMRNIYFWRLYRKKFDNIEQFINFDFHQKDIQILNELIDELRKEKEKDEYIFKESFISPKGLKNYKKIGVIFGKEDYSKFNYKEINNNFDSFYSYLVNKIISHPYKKDIKEKIYKITYNNLNFGKEGKILYNYLLNYDLFKNKIERKISDNNLSQDEFEILLYSLRFIFNTQINNKKCFYNDILKKNTSIFIKNNYIPGSFPSLNEFSKSYQMLEIKLKLKLNIGYYICKDCGYLYEIPPSTFPLNEYKCPNGHIIGGINRICSKKDIRVFSGKSDIDEFLNKWNFLTESLSSFESITLKEFKDNYVDKNIEVKKGIINNYTIDEFEQNYPIRDLNIITFRTLNFILYSYLIGSFILNNLNREEMRNYLVGNLFPHTLFGILKKNWELLGYSLSNIGIENVQTFMNMIFDKIIELINNLDSVDTLDKLYNFEKNVNKYISEIISNKDNIYNINNNYQKMNSEILKLNPQSIKEIIQEHFDPSFYDQMLYPDIQYYTTSKLQTFNSFINKFNSSKENESKYPLINILIKKEEDEEDTINAINMKNLVNINKLANILLKIYSFKISRENAKNKTLKNELNYIIDIYNQMNPEKKITEEDFIDNYINPFIQSWEKIKKEAVQYKCQILRDSEKGEKPLDMNINNKLCYFLVDDGEKDGGMFLAAAYEKLMEWQNSFINLIISNNKMNGILNSYVPQLEQEINIQDATKNEIINIDDNTYKILKDLIFTSSMRNIFGEDNKINYKNYNDIIYDYELIEEELGKLILPGIKKFKKDKIKFIQYSFEGFREEKSSILINYKNKYIQRKLAIEEEDSLKEFLKENNESNCHIDIFSSLLLLMNTIENENYPQDYYIINIIENLPKYIILNEKLIQFFKNKFEYYKEEKVFTINSLVSIFEYLEDACWKDIKKNVNYDYELELPEEAKKCILDYFEKNKNEGKIINKKNLTYALRKLISRSLIGQKIEINADSKLKLYIGKDDLWEKDIIENELFEIEINEIFRDEVLIGHCLYIYNLLKGDDYLLEDNKKKKSKMVKDNQEGEKNNEHLNININNNQKTNNNKASDYSQYGEIKMYEKLQEKLKIYKDKMEKLELAKNSNNTFQKLFIYLLNEKINELKKMKINEITKLDNLLDNEDLNLFELLEETNIKDEKNKNIKLNEKIKELEKQIDEKNNMLKKMHDNKLNKDMNKTDNHINEEKTKIEELNKEISKKNNQINEQKIKIEELNNRISTLTESNNNLKKFFEFIDKKEKDIYTLQSKIPIQLKDGEKLMSVIFISTDEFIHYPIICKNNQIFNVLENLLYEKYPEYKESENLFFVNGRKINKLKTIEENNIKNGNIIVMNEIGFN